MAKQTPTPLTSGLTGGWLCVRACQGHAARQSSLRKAHLLTDVHLDLPPKPTINRLDLVRLIGRQLVVVHTPVAEALDIGSATAMNDKI
eukprot:6421567-Prymnesium_polylepis.1